MSLEVQYVRNRNKGDLDVIHEFIIKGGELHSPEGCNLAHTDDAERVTEDEARAAIGAGDARPCARCNLSMS